jgi:hypothetical protein
VGHPRIDNGTPFVFEPLFIADEDLRPVVVTLIKATYRFNLDGEVSLAAEQLPVNFTGQRWTDLEASSYRYEPEVALCKLATDVSLIGHAHPSGNGVTHLDVGIKVGPVQKVARVFGNRFWVHTDDGVRMSRAAPLERTPLTWEYAFGGQDEAHSTPDLPLFEPRNPIGTGFGTPLTKEGEQLRLPNIEDPNQPITEYGAVVTPCGFGFVAPNWHPRSTFAGTYDEAWGSTRKPMLPADFDRRFFNAAAPGLIAAGYLKGDEEVVLLNVTPAPRVAFRLPGVRPPLCRVAVRNQPETALPTNLDTVIVDADAQQLLLFWRAYTYINRGPHDVSAISVTAAD